MFEIMSRYFWAVALGCVVVGYIASRAISARYTKTNPDFAKGYAKLLLGHIIAMSIPWIVMGIGCSLGGVPSVWHYFRPRDGNPYVLAWYATIVVLWIIGGYWVFFKDGAEVLAKYHDYRGMTSMFTPAAMKLLCALCLAAGVLAFIMIWILDIPL